MLAAIQNSTNDFCVKAYNQGSSTVQWLKDGAASAGETLQKIFSAVTQKLSQWLSLAKEGFFKGVEQMTGLPFEAKVLVGTMVGLTALATTLVCRSLNKTDKSVKPEETTVVETTAETTEETVEETVAETTVAETTVEETAAETV